MNPATPRSTADFIKAELDRWSPIIKGPRASGPGISQDQRSERAPKVERDAKTPVHNPTPTAPVLANLRTGTVEPKGAQLIVPWD